MTVVFWDFKEKIRTAHILLNINLNKNKTVANQSILKRKLLIIVVFQSHT